MAALPEEEIDIGNAALILAKEVFPEIDINEYSAKIDELVEGARNLTKGSFDPEYRVRALNTYLYQLHGLKYAFDDPYLKNLKNRYINGILDSKKGSCVSMPLIYLAIAQRLGYPAYPVIAPQHYFLRYVDPKYKTQNIETTWGGGYSPDEIYIKDFEISQKALYSGAYMRTLTYKEYLGELIGQNGIFWGQRGDIDKAINYLEICINLNPKSSEAIKVLGNVYLAKSKMLWDSVINPQFNSNFAMLNPGENFKKANEFKIKSEQCFKKADELGVTHLSIEDYVKALKEAQRQ